MLSIIAAAVVTLLYSFVSAEIGFFSRSASAGVFAVCLFALLLADRKWHFMPRIGPLADRKDLLLVAVLISACALYFPPSEYILGGWDPGVYVAGGISIERHGGISFDDPLLASLDSVERDLFTAVRWGLKEVYPAWRVMNAPDGNTLTPQFFHMYPVLLALTSAIGGVWGCLCTNPVIALLCILALFALCRAVAGPGVAMLGPLLFVTCPAMIWLARFQNSELLGQLGFLSGFGFLFLAAMLLASGQKSGRQREGTMAYVMSALCFGVAQLARTELLMVSILVLALGVLSLGWRTTSPEVRRARAVWVVCMFMLLVHALVYQRYTARLYTPLGANLYRAALLPVVATVIAAVLWVLRGRIEAMWNRISSVVRWFAAGGLILAVVYVALIRVQDTSLGLERFTFHDIARLVSWPVMILAILGCVTMIVRSRSFAEHALIVAGLISLAGVLHNRLIDPFYLWAARRFASFVLPFLFIAAVAGLGQIVRIGLLAIGPVVSPRIGRRIPELAVAVAACVVVAVSAGDRNAVSGFRDNSGLTEFIRQTAESLPRADLVISEPELRGVPEALHFLHGVPAVCLKNHEPRNLAALEGAIARRIEKGQAVFLLIAEDSPYRKWTRVRLERKREFQWTGEILNQPQRPFPRTTLKRGLRLHLYEAGMAPANK
ncbi:MAG: hypothetical protein WCN95_03385 [bacterium]